MQNIPEVANCMPGAEITEKIDDKHYKGTVKAKIGPATMIFNGDIEVVELNNGERKLNMIARGQDSKGTSSAEMNLHSVIVGKGSNNCELQGDAKVVMNGKAASLGGRIMGQVSDYILAEFGKNFTNKVLALGEGEKSENAKLELEKNTGELNSMVMMWSVIKGFFKNLFGGGKKPGAS